MNILNKLKNSQTLHNYKIILPFIKPYCLRTIFALGLAIPIGFLDAIIAMSLKPYMDIVMMEKNVQAPWYIPILIIVFTTVQGLLNYFSTYFNDWVTGKVTSDLKLILHRKLLGKSSSFFDSKSSGEIQKRFNNDAQSACNGLLGNIKLMISRVCSSISLVFVLIYNSWQLSIVAILMLILAVLPLTKIKSKIKAVTNKSESGNALIITAYNLYDIQDNKLKNNLDNLFNLKMEITRKTGSISPIMHFVVSIGLGFAIGFGSYLITKDIITPGNFVAFITALIMLYTPIKGLGGSAKSIQNSLLAIERVVKNLESPDYIIDKNDAIEMIGLNNSIEFQNVNFEYKKDHPVLKDISFKVNKGETFALVGNSGGGKSTIVNILPRFYKIKKGNILIDGISIDKYKINSLRDNISIVLQDNFLFAGTIRENILLGNPNATQAELNLAIENACLSDFISTLEKGLDTYIGEKGVLLSGGQKQRVAIARAFIKDAPIVILDEATSALDNKSEAIVQQAIDNLMKDKTVFVIAHRLSTIQNADRIAVINKGELVEIGTHNDLMKITNGEYKKLYEMQFK